jgi:chromosomal replication initiator protein
VPDRTARTDDTAGRIQAAFAGRIGAARFGLWFPPNARFVWLGHELVVAARNSHFGDWAADKFGDALSAAVAEACGERRPVRFVADPDLFAEGDEASGGRQPPVTASGPPPSKEQGADAPRSPKAAKPQANLFGELPPPAKGGRDKPGRSPAKPTARRWKTFADFVVGPSNRVAAAAAQAVVEEAGLGPNPLVIHGPVGTGKTHLLEAVHASLRQSPDARPVYVTADDFTSRYVQATRFGKMTAFRRQFRECSTLLFDDLNQLATRKGSLDEFLHTLDALVSDGRQVVVTTDCHPRLADELPPGLADRLLGGAVWGLLPPDDRTRLEILRKKATAPGPTVPDDVLRFLAGSLKGNVRELEGAVNSVRHYARVTGQPVTREAAREAVGDLLRHAVRAVTVADVDAAVCSVLRLSAGTLQSKSRSWAVSHPRMLAVYLARKLTSATYGEIAKHFGVKQHSTAVAAEKKVRGWLAGDESLTVGDRKWAVKDLLARVERELGR